MRQQIVETERRHHIAEALTKRGFPLTDISFEPGSMKLTHLPTHQYFSFGTKGLADDYLFEARCSRFSSEGESGFGNPSSFETVFAGFTSWSDQLRLYVAKVEKYKNAVDPFTSAAKSLSSTEVSANNFPNDAFSPDERVVIVNRLAEFRQYVITNGTLGDQLALLDEKIDYLIDSSSRLGKKDWMNVLMAVIFGLIIAGLFAPDRARELMDYGVGLFASLFQQTHLLL